MIDGCRAMPRGPIAVAPGVRGLIVAVVLALLALACGRDPAPPVAPSVPAPARPSVLLVTIDTLRADRVGCYGRAGAGTAALDRLAAEGTRFERARTAVPITLPAHASILTGLYPMHHGVHDNGIATLGPAARSVVESFHTAGYSCAAFVSAFVLSRRFGLDQGFAVYDEVRAQYALSGLVEERPADQTVDAALAWLATAQEPFFLWVHLFDPHQPYRPPPPFAERFAADPYQGEIAFADAELARLLGAARTRAGERLLVAATADHGEGLGEHGERTHSAFLYDSTLRVPLILSGPGVPVGEVVAEPVLTIDIAPTLLSLAGLPPLGGIDGVPLEPLFAAQSIERAAPQFFETYWGFLNQGWSPLLAVSDGRRKLIDAPRPELYDLIDDAGESDNRFVTDDAAALTMRRAVRTFWQRRRSLSEERKLTAEERRTLDQMGYLGDADGGRGLPLPDAAMLDPKDHIAVLDLQNEVLSLLSRYDAGQPADKALLDQALALVEAGLREHGEAAILHEFAGLTLARQGAHARAIPYLKKCLALRPDNSDARFALGYSLVHGGNPLAGVRELTRCVDAEPGMLKALRLLAEVHETVGRTDQAIGYWQAFVEQCPESSPEAATARASLLRLKEQKAAEVHR